MCLRSLWGSGVASRCAQLHRCRAKHVEEGQLLLAQEPSPENVLIVILSYSGNKSMVRQTRKHLLGAGFPEKAIHVRYGYNIKHDLWMGRTIAGNEVVHLGFLHYWVPYVESLLVGSGEVGTAKKHTVMWVEDDIRVCAHFSDIMEEFAKSVGPICWLGFEQKKWTGSQLVGFKGEGLQLAFHVASNRCPNSRHPFRHLDCLWIQALSKHISWPLNSLATQLDHWSATSNADRQGRHKKRILHSTAGGDCKKCKKQEHS